jgi:hypothetical protein
MRQVGTNFLPTRGVMPRAGLVVARPPMPTFVVSLRLPDSFDEDFIALIPRHRDFINRLLADHVIEAYAISADRSRGWVTMNGESAAAVRAVVEQFPLYQYLRHIEIDELFIFDSAAARFPRISLN